MKKQHTYSPVKGCQHRGFFGGVSRLWLAEDHLLLVRNEGWKELYRKFYFQDIQALVVAENKQRRNQSIIFLVIILFFLVLAGLSGDVGRIIHLAIAFLSFILLSVNWFKGATCTVQISTAVQTTLLPCKRLPVAQKLQKKLNASIEQVQGNFTPDHEEELGRKHEQVAAANHLKQTAKKPEELEEFSLFFDNKAHLISYTLFLLLAIIYLVSFAGRGKLIYILENITCFLALLALVTALYRQSKSKIRGMLANLTWWSSLWLILSVLANFGLLVALFRQMAKLQTMPSNEYELWMMLGQIQPADSLYLRILLITRIVCFSLLGGLGLRFTVKAGGTATDA
ncbi:hypothetical protein [Candidatus Electrothrix sp.]|uniref:hypothetical protein n=2 Tax=Candidatus Electrothrix sp. TaxID=2170559 RepID=UPI0040572C4C